MSKVKVDKKQQGEAVKALMIFMNDLWLDCNKHNDNIIYDVICDTFWTALRMASRYNLKEYSVLIALKRYIDAEYELENGKIEINTTRPAWTQTTYTGFDFPFGHLTF